MLKKIFNGFRYSSNGLKAAFFHDVSFKLEVLVLPVLVIFLYFMPISIFRKTIMFAVYLLVLCVELLNTAIEKLADRITTEHDLAIGFVKDVASSAVMLAIVLAVTVWFGCLCF